MTIADFKIADQFIMDYLRGELIYVRQQWPVEAQGLKEEGRIRINLRRLAVVAEALEDSQLRIQVEALQTLANKTRDAWDSFIVDMQRNAEARGLTVTPDWDRQVLVITPMEKPDA